MTNRAIYLVRRLLIISLSIGIIQLHAREANATISGMVSNPAKAIVSNANITVRRLETAAARETVTNGEGVYSVSGLVPGNYEVRVQKPGFETATRSSLELHTGDSLKLNFELRLDDTTETINVNGEAGVINTNPAVSLTVIRHFVDETPLNGRSLEDLIVLVPGAVSQYGSDSFNGRHTKSNYFMVDRVSGNVDADNGDGVPLQAIAGTVPASTALGTTQALVSVDALQEFKVQTLAASCEEVNKTPKPQATPWTSARHPQYDWAAER